MIEALNEDYVRTARAKGLPEGSVVFRHALRAAIVPVVTIFGPDFAGLLTGTAVVLIGAALIVAANIVVDIVYTLIDPRVRLT